jgi:hypothetical protein
MPAARPANTPRRLACFQYSAPSMAGVSWVTAAKAIWPMVARLAVEPSKR